MKAANPSGPFGGYTRVLHATHADDIMHLVPSMVVQRLPPGVDRGYGPMNRPWALSQFLSRAAFAEEFILMTEPDHVFVAAPTLEATINSPAAFPFWYVDCSLPQWAPQCARVEFNERSVPGKLVPKVCWRAHSFQQER